MTEALFYLDPDSNLNLQNQIRKKLVDAILIGTFPGGICRPGSEPADRFVPLLDAGPLLKN